MGKRLEAIGNEKNKGSGLFGLFRLQAFYFTFWTFCSDSKTFSMFSLKDGMLFATVSHTASKSIPN